MEEKIYKINEGKVISETIEGETIIINLQTGNYYNVNKTAATIWSEIQSSKSNLKIVEYLLSYYGITKENAEKYVKDVVEFLLKEDLIEESNGENSEISTDDSSVAVNKEKKEEFIEPNIEKFDDMKEMIFADPIHDVKEEGWPNIK